MTEWKDSGLHSSLRLRVRQDATFQRVTEKSPDCLQKSASTTLNNDKNIIQPFEWTRIVFLKRQLYFCKLTPRVSGGFSWGSARFGILNGGGEGGALIFCLILFAVTVMLEVVSIKAAGIAFTSVDVNWQNMRMAKQMEASSQALCAVTCAAGRQKGSHSLHVALWKKKHARAEIGVRNALFHTASTVTLWEKKNFFWICLLPPFTRSSWNPRSQSEVKLCCSPAAPAPERVGICRAQFLSALCQCCCGTTARRDLESFTAYLSCVDPATPTTQDRGDAWVQWAAINSGFTRSDSC